MKERATGPPVESHCRLGAWSTQCQNGITLLTYLLWEGCKCCIPGVRLGIPVYRIERFPSASLHHLLEISISFREISRCPCVSGRMRSTCSPWPPSLWGEERRRSAVENRQTREVEVASLPSLVPGRNTRGLRCNAIA